MRMVKRMVGRSKQKNPKDYFEDECRSNQIDKCNNAFEKIIKDCKAKAKPKKCENKAEKIKEEFCRDNPQVNYCTSTNISMTTVEITTTEPTTTETTTLPTTTTTKPTQPAESFTLTTTHYLIGAGILGFLILGLVFLVKWILDKKKNPKKKKKKKEFVYEAQSRDHTRTGTW
ncbi:hypothetical protein GCK72_017676 [Caenorhabditis remanei]|uniref:Uncharacterized protein n=1 Tax=Caenorhabditis remanei TaxID=31234 RepID=A0A6A5G959_CAERE|nr:hypothetical protein GCK72_017676 [Caenorhabditis remanei]KAF1751122.1 hypothetical protein GCK72_017676 [Caenorhabditis remanei]